MECGGGSVGWVGGETRFVGVCGERFVTKKRASSSESGSGEGYSVRLEGYESGGEKGGLKTSYRS